MDKKEVIAVWHSKKVTDIYKDLYSGPDGLSDTNAKERLLKYGPNELEKRGQKSAFTIFLNQFKSMIVWILVIAAIISFSIGQLEHSEENSNLDGIVIVIILIINAIVGFLQEYKAEKSIEALKRLSALRARVLRNGQEMRIESRDLVPGDIILLETGDKVPADARIIDATRFEVDESSLTGESTPVKKSNLPVAEKAALAERTSLLHSSTIITAGKAKAIVVETGMKTEIGKIADLVQQEKSKQTPLQHKLAQLGEFLSIGTLIICGIVFVVGILRSEPLLESFMIAVSLAVAAIPEGLPAVVTTCLALGVRRMVKKNALVRVLPAVETLGSCNTICTDKTGTLTYNQMTVREIFANMKKIDVSGQGYVPEGRFEENGKATDPKKIQMLLKIGMLCNDAKLKQNKGKWEIFGDPTEAALIVTGQKAGLDQDIINKDMPRIDELPFDSTRKLMTTLHKGQALVKGAPDILIEKCDRILLNGKVTKLASKQKKEILNQNLAMANKALRVLGFAYKAVKKLDKSTESKLIFVGLMGMIDPPRSEVVDAIAKCKIAGIKVVMITGDHKATAVAIGKELGLPTGSVLTGAELDEKSKINVDEVTIYARVSPQHKMKIISALQAKGYVVAMTGDGVNDAPALKRADIGVAMGKSGTDVAKEASDMILTDDNFTSIVNTVEEGRGIYDNIQKFVKYLLSSNLGEILTIFIAMLIAYHHPETGALLLPLAAIQLLWINLLTDGLPALALGVEPTDPDVMKQPPRKSKDRIISGRSAANMIFLAVIMAAGTLFMFHISLKVNVTYAVTMAFTTLVVFQLFNVINCKSQDKSVFKTGIFNNKWLILAIVSSFSLQLIVLYTPLSELLKATAIGLFDWLKVFAVASTVLIFDEIRKFIAAHGRT